MAQLMPLPLTLSCFSKIQIGFTFLVPAHLGIPGKRAVKRVCVCFFIYLLCTKHQKHQKYSNYICTDVQDIEIGNKSLIHNIGGHTWACAGLPVAIYSIFFCVFRCMLLDVAVSTIHCQSTWLLTFLQSEWIPMLM